MGLLDLKVYDVLALHQEPDCSAQLQRIPKVPNHRVSLQCPAAEYPCSAQPPSIPAVPNRRVSSVLNRRVSLQCPAAEYPCSAQPPSIPAVPNRRVSSVLNRRVSLQCPAAEYPCSAQPPSIPAVPKLQSIQSILRPNRSGSLQCPALEHPCSAQPSLQCATAEYPCSAQPQSFPIFQETLHLLPNKSFRVGMLEVNNFEVWSALRFLRTFIFELKCLAPSEESFSRQPATVLQPKITRKISEGTVWLVSWGRSSSWYKTIRLAACYPQTRVCRFWGQLV